MSAGRPVASKQARAYVARLRMDTAREATWFDVADAYDAGMLSAFRARPLAKRALRETGKLPKDSERD